MQASLRRIGSIASNRNTCDKWIQNYWHGAMWHAAFNLVSCNVFGHLLDLDLNFHGHRRTGQIMRVLDHGASSIQAACWVHHGHQCSAEGHRASICLETHSP
eukprot:GHRR01010900.1.p2 GENE.GHRR01010900.1~~GHRR01010900.1.p2  ORF type:complete len:102 (+),score=10.02 GHRR01010900.1:674-979(+)